jgi:hypothetical protein
MTAYTYASGRAIERDLTDSLKRTNLHQRVQQRYPVSYARERGGINRRSLKPQFSGISAYHLPRRALLRNQVS